MIDHVAWHELKLIKSNGRAQREYVRCVTLVADKMKCQLSNAWESEANCPGQMRGFVPHMVDFDTYPKWFQSNQWSVG